MKLAQIQLVQESFTRVEPIADVAADLFYARLFTLDPSLRSMFPAELAEQKHKLMTMLKLAVNNLNRLDELVPAVQALGQRHGTYGVTFEQYETVGAALWWSLEQGLGEEFTPDVKAAWVAVYTVLANTMKQAMDVIPA
jgi:hemoglobin-like flavoprotein